MHFDIHYFKSFTSSQNQPLKSTDDKFIVHSSYLFSIDPVYLQRT